MKNYSEEELNRAFQRILNYYKSRYQIQKEPKAFLLGGQPGAGKSSLENMLNLKDEYISISGDDYRKYHPKYDDFWKRFLTLHAAMGWRNYRKASERIKSTKVQHNFRRNYSYSRTSNKRGKRF